GGLLYRRGDVLAGGGSVRVQGRATHHLVLEPDRRVTDAVHPTLDDLAGCDLLGQDVDVLAEAGLGSLDLAADLLRVARGGHRWPPASPLRASGTFLRVSTVRSGVGCTSRSFVRPFA